MPATISGLTGATIRFAPSVCRDCVWWQSRGNRTASKERWIERAQEDWGDWGTIYLDEGGRLLGSLQYGPSHLFPRAADLPAGPGSDDAVLVTCSYLVRNGAEWIEKSLLLAAIGESRDRGAKAMEAFAEYGAWRADSVTRSLARLIEKSPGRAWHGYHISAVDDTKVHHNSPNVWGTCTFHEYTARCPNRATTVR